MRLRTAICLGLLATAAHAGDLDDRSDDLLAQGKALLKAGEYDAGLKKVRDSVDLLKEAQGADSVEVAKALKRLAYFEQSVGQYSASANHHRSAIAILEAVPEPDQLEIATILNNLGAALQALGDLDGAFGAMSQAIEIRERELGVDHAKVGNSVHNLAGLLQDMGDFRGAQVAYERALAIQLAEAGPDSPAVAMALNSLGNLLDTKGDHALAADYFERALAVAEVALGADDPRLAPILSSTSRVLEKQSDYRGARLALERSLALTESGVGPDHPDLAPSLNNLALLLFDLGDLDASGPLLERARAIQEASLGAGHPKLAVTLNNLGSFHVLRDEYDLAELRFREALRISEAQFGPENIALAPSLKKLGLLALGHGDYEAAIEPLQRALTIQDAALDAGHDQLIGTLTNLGEAHRQLGDTDLAAQLFARSLAIEEENRAPDHPRTALAITRLARVLPNPERRGMLRDALARSGRFVNTILPSLSERESLVFAAQSRVVFDAFLTEFDAPEDAQEAWRAVLRFKGGVARAMAARRDTTDDEELATLADLSRKIAGFQFSGAEEMSALLAEREALERTVAAGNPDLRAELVRRAAGPAEICAALPEGAVLLDFVRYGRRYENRYVAFVIDGKRCEVRRVELGLAEDLDTLAAAHRQALVGADSERADRRGQRLHAAIWEPLGVDAERVLIAPDGAIAAVSFAALPDENGRYLVADHTLSYLESATDLLDWTTPPNPSGAIVVGDLNYGAVPADAPCMPADFPPLPGTAREVERIGRIWSKRGREPLMIMAGGAATEQQVIANLAGRRVVHLATHGFFAGEDCASGLTTSSGIGYDPMVLSGVVLSGQDLLTAAEVSLLDLDDTQLVVLSACETGLGAVRSGDGVLGLRRAFAAAGARTLVMSLWSVSDAPTADLMIEMYGGILHKRQPAPAAEALRDAQLSALKAGQPPRDWAAFMAAGDWR